MSKLKKIAVPVYIVVLVLCYFYVKSVLQGVPVSQSDTPEELRKPQEVTVTFTIEDGRKSVSYTQKSKDTDSVADLLLQVKEDHPEFLFDRTSYSYGSEFDHVNGVKPDGLYTWRMFNGNSDITYDMDAVELRDGQTYQLKYVKK